jgi:hypothetical protein
MTTWHQLTNEELTIKLQSYSAKVSDDVWRIFNDEDELCKSLHDAAWKYFDRNPQQETQFTQSLQFVQASKEIKPK